MYLLLPCKIRGAHGKLEKKNSCSTVYAAWSEIKSIVFIAECTEIWNGKLETWKSLKERILNKE